MSLSEKYLCFACNEHKQGILYWGKSTPKLFWKSDKGNLQANKQTYFLGLRGMLLLGTVENILILDTSNF